MKKFIFSLAAIMVMVCTAMSFASCSNDDDNNTTNTVSCKIVFAATTSDSAEGQTKASISGEVTGCNLVAAEYFGKDTDGLFNLKAEEKDGKLVPTTQEIEQTVTAAVALQTVQECITKFHTTYKGSVTGFTISIVSADGNTTYSTNKLM